MSHWLDDVARQVAQGGVSRRSVLRRLGAGVVAVAVAALGRRGARVAAQVTPTRRCLLAAAPNTTYGCLTGQTCCPTVDVQGVCCPAGTLCPPPGNPAGPLCAVCPAGTVICGGGTTAVCCATATTTCLNGACCPTAQVCNGGTVCCAAGTTCIGGSCCPTAQVCGTICCPAGSICQSGICVAGACPAGADRCGSPPYALGCNLNAACRCVTTTEGRTVCVTFTGLTCGMNTCSISDECPSGSQCVLVEGCCAALGQPTTPVCLPLCPTPA